MQTQAGTGSWLTAAFNTAHTKADLPNMLPCADEAEQSDSFQSWPGLFWLPPADDEPAGRDMLCLDDELAGLVEAAEVPADQHGTHVTKREPATSVPGEGSLQQS